MPFTPEQLAKIRQKEATLSEAHKRDPLTNYFEGYFFVTLNTREEAPILSTIEGRVGAQGNDAPHCKYTKVGMGVREVIASIKEYHPYTEVIAAEVMPEHLHMLLYLKPGGKEHLGKVVGGFMGGCSHAYWDVLGIDWRKNHPTQGKPKHIAASNNIGVATPRNAAHDRDHTRSFRGPALFTRGYNDVEPITPEQVQIKIEYIRTQAERRLIKRQGYDRFAIHRDQRSKNWRTDRAHMAILRDPFFARNEAAAADAWKKVQTRLHYANEICANQYNHSVPTTDISTNQYNHNVPTNAPSANQYAHIPTTNEATPIPLLLDYLGNKQLMATDKKLPLICHRTDAGRFEEQRDAVMEAARNGYVIVSAFISPKEREIRERLMCELLPFVEIMDNGFAERYKPGGRAFYACAENRMVQISPWTYIYQKESQVSRELCLVMNELARVISGRDENWWKK